MVHTTILVSFCLIFLSISSFCNGSVSVEEDLTMSSKEKAILDKLRNRVYPHLTDDYMKNDIWIVRWLRARNFDIDAAEKMLMNSLNWRKEYRMDSIDIEDWEVFERKYPYTVNSVNKRQQPLLIISPSTPWDMRSILLTPEAPRLTRWMVKMLEDASRKVREQQEAGQNVTRFSMVNTLENFNLVESGCLRCLSVFAAFANNYESHYPEMIDQMILVNTPDIFDSVLRLIRPLMSPSTRKSLTILGSNKYKWQEILLNDIDSDQLPIDLGGNKADDF